MNPEAYDVRIIARRPNEIGSATHMRDYTVYAFNERDARRLAICRAYEDGFEAVEVRHARTLASLCD